MANAQAGRHVKVHLSLTLAPLGYSVERSPLGGGGGDSAPAQLASQWPRGGGRCGNQKLSTSTF